MILKTKLFQNHIIRQISSKNKISSNLDDYDVVINPDDNLFEVFMQEQGNGRFDFKKEDYSTWKSSWGDAYRFGLILLKGTESIAYSFHTIQYKSLGLQPDFRHLGMAWVPEKYRGKSILKVVTDYLIQEERMKHQNMLACNVHWSQNFWLKATGRSDIGACTYYISYYELYDFKVPIPKIKDDCEIVVKNVNTKTVTDVLKYDTSIFPFNRKNWIESLFLEGIGRVAYNSDGNVVGIGCLSTYPSGECVISPLYADNTKIAQKIFGSMLEEVIEKNKKIRRFQVRSNDQCSNSYEWIQPFLKIPLRRSHLSNLCYSIYPPRHYFNFNKVFVNAHPTNAPC
ncbi:DUF1248 domain-containing protein [Caenorhabditis elegans]|uniref:DUF1248 domain-containing protein n=1 Tax=Caenorhabditis elegans TaxID=6239 RepID=Q20811_CAEEL|nr:DUF1248 domain-containing protein [Caenorhabditis elegans]CCD71876.1 DUF1248 domain-containing protein [Caenorhabditis elegans]|eukprot:NP_495173.3 Uncharacterized protein CELE_F55C12.6 [Caenorhabditis elegans]